MKNLAYYLIVALLLVTLSAAVYFVHFQLFHDEHHLLMFGLHELAFLPIEVLVVTLIIHNLLERRERAAMLNKLNMVIGAFFSEVGTPLLRQLCRLDPAAEELARHLIVETGWADRDFSEAADHLAQREMAIDAGRDDLAALRQLLIERRTFLLRLLENPNLLEHESFTDLLWAVFHLTEELAARDDLATCPQSDLEHLTGDALRAYRALVAEWLAYMRHLRDAYPYLFSLAVRTNPFNPEATPQVAG